MDKYKKTAGLNYLSENSYKGDGSPGMVMGIASDARGDTNTNEAQKPTTSSNHSTERDKKTYDPAHGHSKPEGGNPQVCHLCKGEGCEPCGHTGEEITKRRNDPKVDEALDSIKKLSGLEENISDNKLPTIDQEMDSYFGSKPETLEEFDWTPGKRVSSEEVTIKKCQKCDGDGTRIDAYDEDDEIRV